MVVAALAHQLSAFDRLSERALERLGAALVADHDQRVAANATIERRHAEMRDARQAIATFDAQPSSERRVMLFERGVNLARATKDRQSELDWLVELGEAASRIRPALAIESLEDALILAEDLGDERMQRDIVGRLASARRRTGDTQEARTWYERAIALARASGDGVTEARWTLELGELLTTSGRLDAGEDRIEAAAALARDLSDRALTHRAMAAQARLAELRAEIPTARRHLEDALRGATDDADGELAALLHLRLAWLDRQVGAASNAWHHATQAGLGRSQEIRAAAAIEAAKSLALAGLAPRATAGLTPWLDVARDLGDRRLEAQIHMALAWVWSRNEPRTVAADDLFAASELQATILELDDALVNVVPIALGEVDEEGHRRARVESHLRAALDVEPDAPPETLEARQLALADVLQTHAEAP
jgi:tetratricopeptide (TPR) repeat protein